MPINAIADFLGIGRGFGGSLIRTGLRIGAAYAISKLRDTEAPRVSNVSAASPEAVSSSVTRPEVRRPGPAVASSQPRWILGTKRTGGELKFFQQIEDVFWQAFYLAEGPCEGITRIWVDGQEATFTRTGNHLVLTGDFEDNIEVYEYFAADASQGDEIRAACSFFTAQHKWTNCSYVAIKLTQPNWGEEDKEKFWERIPEVEFEVAGLRFTWPGQDTPMHTNNPAAVHYWLDTNYGDIQPSQIDRTFFDAAFAVCAGSTTFSGVPRGYTTTMPLYEFDMIITGDMSLDDIRAEIDYCWSGEVAISAGVHYYRPGADREPRYHIVEEDLVRIHSIGTVGERVNGIRMGITQSADHDYIEFDVPKIVDTVALARDRRAHTVDLGSRPSINYPVKAAYLNQVHLRKARDRIVVSLDVFHGPEATPFAYYGLIPGDWVTLTIDRYSYNRKLFQVYSKLPNDDGTVSLLLEEQSTGNYSTTFGSLPGLPEIISLPSFRQIPEVIGLNLDEFGNTQEDGTVLVSNRAQWQAQPYHTQLEQRVQGTTEPVEKTSVETGNTASFAPVRVGETYEVRARHFNSENFYGPWSTWVSRLIRGDVTPPEDPTGVTFTAVAEGWRVHWDDVVAEDYKDSRIFLTTNVGSAFSEGFFIEKTDSTFIERAGFEQVTAVKIWVQHVDNSGNKSNAVAVSGSTGKVAARNIPVGDGTDRGDLRIDDNGNLAIGLQLLQILAGILSRDPTIAPELTITDIDQISEQQLALLTATVTGGTYDRIEFRWELIQGHGSLSLPSE